MIVGNPQSNYRTLIEQLITVKSKNDENLLSSLKEALTSGGLKIKYSPTKPIHSKVYIIRKDLNLIARYEDEPDYIDYDIAFLGSSNLTYHGLVHNIELNKKITNKSEIIELKAWFNELWKDSTLVDISEELAWSDLKYEASVINFGILSEFIMESGLRFLLGENGEIYHIPDPELPGKKTFVFNPGFEEVVTELISNLGLAHLHIPEEPEEGRWVDEAPDFLGMSLLEVAKFCQENPDYYNDKLSYDLMTHYITSPNYD
jgi:hypothetical protein